MTQTMLEKVARAICRAGYGPYADADSALVDSMVERDWRQNVMFARAALEAMREPNTAMIEAGAWIIDHYNREQALPEDVAREVYLAMAEARQAKGGGPLNVLIKHIELEMLNPTVRLRVSWMFDDGYSTGEIVHWYSLEETKDADRRFKELTAFGHNAPVPLYQVATRI